MSVNIQALGWSDLFQKQPPKWPDQLTKADWDAKKGKIVTALKSTGIGEALAKLEKVFAAVQWEFVGGGGEAQIKGSIENCKKFLTSSNVTKLHAEFKAARDVAKKAGGELKKNPLIPPSTKKLIDEIAEGCDHLMVCVNPGSLSGCLTRAIELHRKGNLDKQIMQTTLIVQAAKGVDSKVHKAVEAMRKALETAELAKAAEVIKNQLFSRSRDMTQPLANLLKSAKAGATFVHFNQGAIQNLANSLTPYGDGDASKCDGLSKEEIGTKIDFIENAATTYGQLVAPIAYTPPV